MQVLETRIELGAPGQIVVTTVINIGDEAETPIAGGALGSGPSGEAIPDQIVQELISSSPNALSLAELQQYVGGNPATVSRQAWTLATNAPDLQLRLKGWVESAGRGRYALSPAARRFLASGALTEPEGTVASVPVQEFENGVAFWNTHDNWRSDFHNADYRRWSSENPHGRFSIEWWGPFLKDLQRWIATRPSSGFELTKRFTSVGPRLAEAWETSCEPFFDLDISGVQWDQVKAFPEVVAMIKPTLTPSAVFTSKFCHFLMPQIFPVVDNEALGNAWPSYEKYFRFVQTEWAQTPIETRTELRSALTSLIESGGGEVCEGFPFATKIVELRLMGRRNPRPNNLQP